MRTLAIDTGDAGERGEHTATVAIPHDYPHALVLQQRVCSRHITTHRNDTRTGTKCFSTQCDTPLDAALY